MKKSILAALCAAAVLPLMAAESVPFNYQVQHTTGRIVGKTAVKPDAPIKAECKADTKSTPYFLITVPNAEDGAIYRLIITLKTAEPAVFYERAMHTGKEKWETGATTRFGLQTFYMIGDSKAKMNGWSLSFEKKNNFEITSLNVEKLSAEDLKKNLVYKDGIALGLWQDVWPKKRNTFAAPELKKESASPNGEYLCFPAQIKDSGYPSLLAVPFIPNKEYEISIWLRSKEGKGRFHMQLLNATGRETFGFKPEWTEYKLKGKTGEERKWQGAVFMIASFGIQLPSFDMGGITFRYLEK